MDDERDIISGKTVLIDSSSAIIIYKSGLIDHLIDFYSVVISESVFTELTREGYAGAETFKRYCHEKKIGIGAAVRGINSDIDNYAVLAKIGAGERDTILLYLKGAGKFIIVDDGRAAHYCKNRGIPYINALLVPRLLLLVGRIDADERNQFMDKIIENGRYSRWVIDYARTCDDKELAYFQ